MAGGICVVYGCNIYHVKNSSKSFFSFPRDITRCIMELKELFHIKTARASFLPFSTSWSDDDRISVVAESGVHVMDGLVQKRIHLKNALRGLMLFCLLLALPAASASNITYSVFGPVVNGVPAAFGDYNSDDLTDLFILRDSMKTLEVLLASSDREPLLKTGFTCKFPNLHITSVVPGFFDDDPYLDIILTSSESEEDSETEVWILWGGKDYVNCSQDTAQKLFSMRGQPLAIDYNGDMVVDLFGETTDEKRMFWIFSQNRSTEVTKVEMKGSSEERLRRPHSHAFIDLNEDAVADLLLTTEHGFELWLGHEKEGFVYNKTIPAPESKHVGQSIFIDLELKGKLTHLVPVCLDHDCFNTTIYAYADDKWRNLNVKFELDGKVWGFAPPKSHKDVYAITLRAGDYNLDGYPDLLATLRSSFSSNIGTYLLQNVPCSEYCDGMERKFSVSWDALNPVNNGSVMGVFYDLYQDGILDVILLNKDHHLEAFRNTLDYDANFVKVMVLTGPDKGGSYPGPRISYKTTTNEGKPRVAVSTQLPQSAHFSLHLPYTTFGLGRTSNFVDTLSVGALGLLRDWTQIIPNSQLVVVLWSKSRADKWQAHLFVTPSKSILLSAVALLGTCVLITLIIGILHWQEKRIDRVEKLQEAHRFHFDAM